MAYKYKLGRCKVKDKDRLREFRQLRKKWISWINGPIIIEIASMMTNDVLFRTINEARRIATEKPDDTVDFNGHVAHLLDAGFVTAQLMSIRRLVDESDDVISLRRLYGDLKKHKHLITREIYVCYDGLPYDFAPVRQKQLFRAAVRNGSPLVARRVPNEGPRAWAASQRLHEQFDKLSSKGPTHRQRGDCIRGAIFKDIESRFDLCSKMRRAATEKIAHLPDPKTWRQDRKQNPGIAKGRAYAITLGNIRQAQRAICQISHIISGSLLWNASYSLVAIPPYDYLKHFDKGWCSKENLNKLRRFWEQQANAVDEWTNFEWP